MDEELWDRLQRVRRYCKVLINSDISNTMSGINLHNAIRRQVAIEVLMILGEDLNDYTD